MIERNLERLKPEEQAVLEVASVAGPEFSVAPVAAALERPQNEIEGAARAYHVLYRILCTRGEKYRLQSLSRHVLEDGRLQPR